VLNRVAGDAHFRMLGAAICQSSVVPVLGWLPLEADAEIPERHLGLRTAAEGIGVSLPALTRLGNRLDLDQLLNATSYNQRFESAHTHNPKPKYEGVRVGVARDQAFSFYYEDNLDLLRSAVRKSWSSAHSTTERCQEIFTVSISVAGTQSYTLQPSAAMAACSKTSVNLRKRTSLSTPSVAG